MDTFSFSRDESLGRNDRSFPGYRDLYASCLSPDIQSERDQKHKKQDQGPYPGIEVVPGQSQNIAQFSGKDTQVQP
jgi:hypothetical protein